MKFKKNKARNSTDAPPTKSFGRRDSSTAVLLKGLFVRICFFFHSLLYVWRVISVAENNFYFVLIGVQLISLIEAAITLNYKRNGWEWFTPCIFIYICNVVPCVWLIEFNLVDQRLEFISERNLSACVPPPTNESAWLAFYDVTIPVALTDESWALALQQILIFILIVGRWILPRGDLSHEGLSNLLLINIGMAADLVEFLSEGLQADGVKCNRDVIFVVLIIWSVSILQFPFQWDSKALRKLSVVSTLARGTKGSGRLNWLTRCFLSNEVWAILSIVVMQDGPFLGMRIYLIYLYGVSDQSLVFFSAKNALVLMLQFYRLWALLCLEWDAEEGRLTFKLSRKIKSFRRTIRHLGGGSSRDRQPSDAVDMHLTDYEKRRPRLSSAAAESVEYGENQFRVVDDSGTAGAVMHGNTNNIEVINEEPTAGVNNNDAVIHGNVDAINQEPIYNAGEYY